MNDRAKEIIIRELKQLVWIKGVLFVRVRKVLVVWVLGDVELLREKRPHAPQLQNTFAAVHDCDFVL